ncbi:MAG: DUF3160 domain-containing protein [Calditrichaeota bacterium]|nr:DUF3160 domain-containing protein [Calditrichota bacterium]
MKKLLIFWVAISCLLPSIAISQSNFDINAYSRFLQENRNLTYEQLQAEFTPKFDYYKGLEQGTNLDQFLYFDSVKIKFGLTEQEIELIKLNQFVVTERLNFNCFGEAFHSIYIKDLPVFISTDAILHALHASYNQILIDIELSILKPNLFKILDGLYASFPALISKYSDESDLQDALKDIDLYVTIAKSLLSGTEHPAQFTDQRQIDEMWNAIQKEQVTSLPLFSERTRTLDFSQFKVRGHYNNKRLKDYFKAMMWLGRIDFFLTPPPENPFEPPWTRQEIRRMNLGAFMLNELIDLANVRSFLEQNDEIISFMVGEPDNITPKEFSRLITSLQLKSSNELLDDDIYDQYLNELKNYNSAEQKILSQILMTDPFNEEPGELPISA